MVNKSYHADVGILGAGIMGCCLALELAQRGYKFDLIDLASTPMTEPVFTTKENFTWASSTRRIR